MDKQRNTAAEVLQRVEGYIEKIEQGWLPGKLRIQDYYDDLSIFDWWPEYISKSKLGEMRQFLKEAIKLGYEGYVCFKVGATGCANGMWAHKEESTDGYSPDGDFLYRSFTPDYTNWQAKINNVNYPEATGAAWDSCKTAKQLEVVLASL